MNPPSIENHPCLINAQAGLTVTDCSDRKNSNMLCCSCSVHCSIQQRAVRKYLYALNVGTVAKMKLYYNLKALNESSESSQIFYFVLSPNRMISSQSSNLATLFNSCGDSWPTKYAQQLNLGICIIFRNES